MRFAIFITQRARCCFHMLCLCLLLIGFRDVCLVSHWLPHDSRCHGLPQTPLHSDPLQPGVHLESAFALMTTPGFTSKGTSRTPSRIRSWKTGLPGRFVLS